MNRKKFFIAYAIVIAIALIVILFVLPEESFLKNKKGYEELKNSILKIILLLSVEASVLSNIISKSLSPAFTILVINPVPKFNKSFALVGKNQFLSKSFCYLQ